MKYEGLKQVEYPIEWGLYYDKAEVDEAIAKLKARIQLDDDEMAGFLQLEEECGGGDLRNYIAQLKRKLEDAKATAYTESVDAGMRERRLRRALWVTRTAMAKSEKDRWNSHVDCGNKRNRKDPAFVKTGKLLEVSEWRKLWADNERKCRAKAEEYK